MPMPRILYDQRTIPLSLLGGTWGGDATTPRSASTTDQIATDMGYCTCDLSRLETMTCYKFFHPRGGTRAKRVRGCRAYSSLGQTRSQSPSSIKACAITVQPISTFLGGSQPTQGVTIDMADRVRQSRRPRPPPRHTSTQQLQIQEILTVQQATFAPDISPP